MQYRIRLIQSEKGWAVSCPSLPGCHSQGDTREEAVENIKAAPQEWLQVEAEESGVSKVEEDAVTVSFILQNQQPAHRPAIPDSRRPTAEMTSAAAT